MNVLLWIGSILLWLAIGTAIGRRLHLYEKRKVRYYTTGEAASNLVLGLLWPFGLALGIVASPFIGAYAIMTMPTRKEQRDKKLLRLREQQQEKREENERLQREIAQLETLNQETDALIAKLQGTDLR